MEKYRGWFLAAAVFNAVWGAAAVLFPRELFAAVGVDAGRYPSLFQAIGMMVFAYAPGYWLVWRDPRRFGPFVWVGLIGKTLGPIGFLVATTRGELPLRFGWLICLNDLPWLPAFAMFATTMLSEDRASRGARKSEP